MARAARDPARPDRLLRRPRRGAATAASGTAGIGRIENDTGPDDANHDRNGICVIAGPGVPAGRRDDLAIYDIAPTILALAGVGGDRDLRGRVVV